MLRTKKPRCHVSCQRRVERPVASGVDESWSMDFMGDEIFDGRRTRLLTMVDNFTRESLAIKVAASIKGWSGVGLQPAWKAYGQRLHHGVQRAFSPGVPERELVPIPGGRRGEDGNLTKTLQTLQRGEAPPRAEQPVPEGVCRGGNDAD